VKVEEFLIAEAIQAGVVKVKRKKIQRNPNRWAKHLAPWYGDNCRIARQNYKRTKRTFGKKD
jgi:hypothetical protein